MRIGTVGTGKPTTSGQTITNLPGIPTAGLSPDAFAFADLSSSVAGVDTLYIADDAANAIKKFSLVSGSWVANGSVSATSVRGLALSLVGTGTVDLFGTSNGTSGTLYGFVDTTGYNGTISGSASTLGSGASMNEAFRGIAVVVPEPSTLSLLAGAVLLGAVQYLRRRRL